MSLEIEVGGGSSGLFGWEKIWNLLLFLTMKVGRKNKQLKFFLFINDI